MVTVDYHEKKRLRGLEKLPEYVAEAVTELSKLMDYYTSEIKQTEIDIKRSSDPEEIAFDKGRIEAYADHIAEVKYIIDIFRGTHDDSN